MRQEINRNMRTYTKRKPFQKICLHCESSYEAGVATSKFCSKDCYLKFGFDYKQKVLLKGEEGVDYVIDLWNGYATPRIYGKWFKVMHPDRTLEEYKTEFPNAPLYCSSDRKATTINGGKHMKEEKYRKMASEQVKGQNNPMSRSKASEQKRKETSPFSIEFYRKRFPDNTEEEYKKMVSERANFFLKDRKTWTQVEYWIEKGMSHEEAAVEIAKRQSRDLAFFQKKYGEEGKKLWEERQKNWKAKVFNEDQWIGRGRSNVSEKFFDVICSLFKDKVKRGSDEKFIWDKELQRAYKYDLVFVDLKKIIEFNGDFWHCNPNKFKPDYFHKVKKMTAQEIWEYDRIKKEKAEQHGYQVMVVWESEWTKDPESALNKCREFLCV